MSPNNKLMDDFFESVQYDQPAEDWRTTPATAEDPDEEPEKEGGLRQQVKKALSLGKHLLGLHDQASHGSWATGLKRDDDIPNAHMEKWLNSLDLLDGQGDYAMLLTLMAESIINDDGELGKFVGLKDGSGMTQAVASYQIKDTASSKNIRPLIREANLPSGKYLLLQTLAVAPWHHPTVPGRVKGYGTAMFVEVAKLLKGNIEGMLLKSQNGESDKFYDALGLSPFYVSGEKETFYYLMAADAKDVLDAYQARLQRSGETRRLDLQPTPAGEKPAAA